MLNGKPLEVALGAAAVDPAFVKKLDADAAPTGDPVQLTADRGSAYGAPEDNHAATADFFSVWLARKYGPRRTSVLDPEDVVAFNICQKLSRAANAFKADNWHDIQGYAQNALDMSGGGREVGTAPAGYVPPAAGRSGLAYEAGRQSVLVALRARAEARRDIPQADGASE